MVKMIELRVYMYCIITESKKKDKIKAFAIVNYGLINQIKRLDN